MITVRIVQQATEKIETISITRHYFMMEIEWVMTSVRQKSWVFDWFDREKKDYLGTASGNPIRGAVAPVGALWWKKLRIERSKE